MRRMNGRVGITSTSGIGMRTHIKVVGWVHIVFGILGLLGAASILFGGLFGGIFSGSISTMVMMGVSSVIMGVISGVIALFGLVAAFAFLSHRPWARYVLILVSILGLFRFPFGTLFSIYALWVLFNRETVEIFRAQERMGN